MALNNETQNKATEKSLLDRAVGGFGWIFSGSLLMAVLKIVVLGILARLLSQSDFGVVGACMTIFGLADIFTSLGGSIALVQKKEITQKDIETGFTITVLSSVAVATLLFFLAPVFAELFREELLVTPFRVMSCLFPIAAIGAVSAAIIQRNMQFKQKAIIEIVSYLAGYALVTIILAYLGFGYWAPVIGQGAQFLISSAAMFFFSKIKLKLSYDRSSADYLLRFGVGDVLSRIGIYFSLNGDYFVVGRMLGTEALGVYSRTYVLTQQPTKIIGSLGDQVLFPVLSSIHTEEERVVRAFYRSKLLVFIVCTFMCSGIFVLSKDIIAVLLGAGWKEAILPLQILALSLPFRIAYKFNSTALRSKALTMRAAAVQWIYAVMVIVGAYCGHFWGVPGVAAGIAVAILSNYFAGIVAVKTAYPISIWNVVRIILTCTILFVAIGFSLMMIMDLPWLIDMPALVRLMIGGAILGLLALLVLFNLQRLFGDEGKWVRERLVGKFVKI